MDTLNRWNARAEEDGGQGPEPGTVADAAPEPTPRGRPAPAGTIALGSPGQLPDSDDALPAPPASRLDPSALFEPSVIAGEYRVLQQLGAGGMGVVYLAERMRDGGRVALKLMRPQYLHDQTLCARLRREAQAVRMVQHPNVIQTLDAGEDESFGPFVAFEHLTGQSLCDRLDALGKLPVETALRVMDGVLAALTAAHSAGVVHRDLKPDNVFLVPGVTDTGDACEHVKVLDFGISRILHDGTTEEQKLTRTGTVMGTPVYMSPEQALGKPTQDHRVDVYAAGVMLYEMLSGALPHEGENYNQVLAHALSADAVPLTRRGTHVDPALAEVVHRAIARDVLDRYASAEAFRDALASWARGSLVSIPRTSMKLLDAPAPRTEQAGPAAFAAPAAVVDPGARPEAVTLDAPPNDTSVFSLEPAPARVPTTKRSPAVIVADSPASAGLGTRSTLPALWPRRRRWVASAAAAGVAAALTVALLVRSAPAPAQGERPEGGVGLLHHALGPALSARLELAGARAVAGTKQPAARPEGEPVRRRYSHAREDVPLGSAGDEGELGIVADNPYAGRR